MTVRAQTVAFDAKCNHKNVLYRCLYSLWAHMFGHTLGHSRRVFRWVCSENGRKTRQGDGFFDRRLNQEAFLFNRALPARDANRIEGGRVGI
jgi:hypothetical protein